MTINEHIKHWVNGADHDIQVSQNLFKMGNYDWCLFIGHIVVEKTLKAIYVQNNQNKIPPKTHRLVKLAQLSSVPLTKEQEILFDEITDFNIEARYPQYKKEFYKICTQEYANHYLNKILEIHKWLKSHIKLI